MTPAIIKLIIMQMEISKAIEGRLNICAYIQNKIYTYFNHPSEVIKIAKEQSIAVIGI